MPILASQCLRQIQRYTAWTTGGIILTGLLMGTALKAIADTSGATNYTDPAKFSGQNVKTDNADNTNAELPPGVTIPPISVVQPQTPAVDPTQVTVINPAVSSNPKNLILVKRITAVRGGTITLNGDNLATYNQDNSYPYDDNEIEPSLAPNLPAFPTADSGTQPALAEDNGTIVVNLGNVPNATTSGTPKESYGFLRFRARVK